MHETFSLGMFKMRPFRTKLGPTEMSGLPNLFVEPENQLNGLLDIILRGPAEMFSFRNYSTHLVIGMTSIGIRVMSTTFDHFGTFQNGHFRAEGSKL